MTLGQWLDARGLSDWGPRAASKVGREIEDGDHANRTRLVGPVGNLSGNSGGKTTLSVKRDRVEYETPDFIILKDRQKWVEEQMAVFVAAAKVDTGGHSGTLNPTKHAAIFKLVYGMLASGEERRHFNEYYLPWLNGLDQHRFEAEFCTLYNYLKMVNDLGLAPTLGMMKAYLKAVLAQSVSR